MRISVLIVSYRRPRLLGNCLRALEKQTRLPDDIIVVGAEQDQTTRKVVEQFAEASPVPCIWQATVMPNIVAQSNLGLKLCKCDIVAMTNDDAEPFPDWLERMEPYYEDSTVGGVGGRDFVYEDGQLWQGQADRVGEIVWFGRHYGNHSLSYPRVRDVHLLKGVNISCRRDLLQPLDTRMVPGGRWHWEIDMCFQIRRQGKRLVFDPNIRVDHFHGPRPGVLDPGFVYAANHNLTLNLVKHLYPAQRLIFLVYTFLWGSYPEMGLAVFGKTYLGRLLGHRDWGFALLLGISFKAKIDALRALAKGGDLDR